MPRKALVLGLMLLVLAVVIIAANRGVPFVDKSLCVGCSDCVQACPVNAISIYKGRASIDPELCIDCKICVKTCTYKAIKDIR